MAEPTAHLPYSRRTLLAMWGVLLAATALVLTLLSVTGGSASDATPPRRAGAGTLAGPQVAPPVAGGVPGSVEQQANAARLAAVTLESRRPVTGVPFTAARPASVGHPAAPVTSPPTGPGRTPTTAPHTASAVASEPPGLPRSDRGWTAGVGVAIAERALQWLNWPYSFAGGNAKGPTYGTAVDHASRNDAGIRGFDCSGLVVYALAPWLQVSHNAAAQYVQAGTVHPDLDELLPGDLIFWSADGTIKGVGHVAIYIGNGDVVQGPQSGDIVRVTRIDQVESATMGTTRPLT